MKIGILTFHRSINYGAFMQCFSLLNRMKKDFPNFEIEVVDFTPLKIKNSYINIINHAKTEDLKIKYQKRADAFEECYGYLNLSKDRIETDDHSVIAEYLNKTYDAVVVGSDAVWNWTTRGFPNIYFLKDYHGLKFSFAASAHGLNYETMTDEQRKYLAEAFKDFKYIGVRDTTTEKLVNNVSSDLKVYHNCDPTAFLDFEDIPCDREKLRDKLQKQGVDFSKPLVGLMAGPTIGREIKKKFGNTIQLVALYENNPFADVYLNDLTPFEWACTFSFFKLTLTHYFHGTMLSLKSGVPVMAVETLNAFSATHTTKIKDILTRLGLNDWHREMNHLSCNKIERGLYRFGLKSDRDLWDDVFKHMYDFLENDFSSTICEKLKVEAQNYNTFYDAVKDSLMG